MIPEAKQSIAGGKLGTHEKKVLDKTEPEEFRQMLMTAFALIQSLTAGAANQIKRANRYVIANLKKKRNITLQFIPCTKEYYYELQKTSKKSRGLLAKWRIMVS